MRADGPPAQISFPFALARNARFECVERHGYGELIAMQESVDWELA